jgi:molybdopterin molybdotransferase
MAEFLHLIPPEEALKALFDKLPLAAPRAEMAETTSAIGRVTAEAVRAGEMLPGFARSTVDGYAVRAADTYGASESLPAFLNLAGEVRMGSAPGFSIRSGEAAFIHTGGMLPEGADAAVMIENTQTVRPGEIEVLKAAGVGENIIQAGEDVQIGDTVIQAGKPLREAEIGGLLALGITQVKVVKKPRVGILSSGDEVISPFEPLKIGQVRDVNSYTLKALVEKHGGEGIVYGILPDHLEEMEASMARALGECDLVVITAGSSASTRDLTAEVIQKSGKPGVLVHGVNIRPGKPTILAVCDGKAVIGLPGNPVSALVIAGLFVKPVVEYLQGLPRHSWRAAVRARLTAALPSQAGREDWYPVRVVETDQGLSAEPVFYKSNLIFNLVQADGLVKIAPDATGLAAGEEVEVFPL